MIVVDTNILAYFYLAGERTIQVERAYARDPHWAAPLLWRSEFRNVLAHYIRKEMLSLSGAVQIMDAALNLMHGSEYDIPSLPVLELVAASKCPAYDCEYVTLAQSLDIPLVTVDRQILAQFPSIAVPLDDFSK
jgi:predicted nucleic acid-binding protein